MNRLVMQSLLFTLLTMLGCSGSIVQRKASEQEKAIERLQEEVQSLNFNRTVRSMDEIAYLTPGKSGFSVIQTTVGAVTVTLNDIQPYANGSKVTLVFGNVTSATFENVKAKVDWGPVDAKGVPNNAEAKSKDIDFKKPLNPGVWTSLDVILEGIPPTNLGFVRVHDLRNESIRLRR